MSRMETQLTWFGHAAFKIATAAGKVLLIDPWLTNPVFPRGKEELAALDHADLILLTHGRKAGCELRFERGDGFGAWLPTSAGRQ